MKFIRDFAFNQYDLLSSIDLTSVKRKSGKRHSVLECKFKGSEILFVAKLWKGSKIAFYGCVSLS